MVDEVDWHTMVVVDKSKIKGIIDMLTIVLNPPRGGGVKAASKTSNQRLTQNASIVARKTTEKASGR